MFLAGALVGMRLLLFFTVFVVTTVSGQKDTILPFFSVHVPLSLKYQWGLTGTQPLKHLNISFGVCFGDTTAKSRRMQSGFDPVSLPIFVTDSTMTYGWKKSEDIELDFRVGANRLFGKSPHYRWQLGMSLLYGFHQNKYTYTEGYVFYEYDSLGNVVFYGSSSDPPEVFHDFTAVSEWTHRKIGLTPQIGFLTLISKQIGLGVFWSPEFNYRYLKRSNLFDPRKMLPVIRDNYTEIRWNAITVSLIFYVRKTGSLPARTTDN